jgi:hypothetical protein
MLSDGTSTASDVGAKLYNLLKADVANKIEEVAKATKKDNEAMASIDADAGVDKGDDDEAAELTVEDLLTEDEQALLADADIVIV